MIMILTHARDGSADMVLKHLTSMGKRFVRFNTEQFPQTVGLDLSAVNGKIDGHLVFKTKTIEFKEIKVIWNRRPHKPEISALVRNERLRNWAQEEAEQALQLLYFALEDRIWINKVAPNDLLQFNKILQMKYAAEAGLHTPETLISNIPKSVKRFAQRKKHGVALKVLKSGVIQYSANRMAAMYTKRLKSAELTKDALRSIQVAPSFFQEYVDKAVELRLTVVGNRIFSCKIYSQELDCAKEDWRRGITKRGTVRHELFSLPKEIEKKCLRLMRNLDLTFGCIDMILTPEGNYVFLEVNPNGQWGWIEQMTGAPISRSIAELLSKASSEKISTHI